MEIRNVLKILEDNGYEAYIVGGYVRDYLLRKETNDIDICTNAKVLDIISLFDNVISYSEEFGNVKLDDKKYNFDITTYRKEVYKSNRRDINILFVNDIREDVIRRDFTINSLYMDSKGNIIDLVNGRKDIEKGLIKCIGDINIKMTEDPLRILRAVRFATVLNFNIDDELYNYIKNNGRLLENISTFRIKEELKNIFLSDNIDKGLFYLSDLNLWKFMGISFKKLVKVNNLYGMFAQFELSREYSFKKKELRDIKIIKEIVKYGKIDNMIIYKCGICLSQLSGKILGIKKDYIDDIYDNMVIKCEADINIARLEIYNLFNVKNINYILDEVAFLILNGVLENSHDLINEYLLSNREKWLCERASEENIVF